MFRGYRAWGGGWIIGAGGNGKRRCWGVRLGRAAHRLQH